MMISHEQCCYLINTLWHFTASRNAYPMSKAMCKFAFLIRIQLSSPEIDHGNTLNEPISSQSEAVIILLMLIDGFL